ncbi:MAG: FAD-binding protein [Planctomycetia bacterium]|nr:FAD-binding protein [Planctomycetia bacterium]
MTEPPPPVSSPRAATISPAAAARTPWQVLVVGAGPAGATAAHRLAVRGFRVLLVDRGSMPRWKVCGCCLSLAAIDELRLFDGLAGSGRNAPLGAVRLHGVRVAHRGRAVVLPLPGGAIISRERLDAALVEAAITAGSAWLPHGLVTGLVDDGASGVATATLAVRPGADAAAVPTTITAEYVVLATGLADRVRIGTAAGTALPTRAGEGTAVPDDNRVGLGTALPPGAADLPLGELTMAIGSDGYCGLVRLEDGRIDVAAAVSRVALARHASPGHTVAAILAAAAGDGNRALPSLAAIAAAKFRATPPLTRRAPLVAGTTGRILRCGDAACYVEPFTGEGIGWALASGRILAESLVAAHQGVGTSLGHAGAAASRYEAAHRHRFESAHARCRRAALSLRHPAMRMATLGAARMAPWAARRLLPMVIGGRSREGCR